MGPYKGAPVKIFAAGAQKHPNQDRIAVVSGAFGDGLQLYIADGVAGVGDIPETVYKITDDAKIGVYEPVWKKGNRLEYVMDYTRYQLKIPPSYVVLEHKTVTENILNEEENKGGDTA